MRSRVRIIAPAMLCASALTALVLPAAASARTVSARAAPGTVIAVTHLSSRPDSGGNGNWADDSISRVLVIRPAGGTAGAYDFTASIQDTGTFTTIPAAFTPNQGAPFAGDRISQVTHGSMQGEAQFSFTASELPSAAPNAGVPFSEAGTPSGEQTTNLWYEQAFPAGTSFNGTGIENDWSWDYDAIVQHVTVTSRYEWVLEYRRWVRVPVPVRHVQVLYQHWADSAAGDGGQLPADGNITG